MHLCTRGAFSFSWCHWVPHFAKCETLLSCHELYFVLSPSTFGYCHTVCFILVTIFSVMSLARRPRDFQFCFCYSWKHFWGMRSMTWGGKSRERLTSLTLAYFASSLWENVDSAPTVNAPDPVLGSAHAGVSQLLAGSSSSSPDSSCLDILRQQ